jgi:hypothetical protein
MMAGRDHFQNERDDLRWDHRTPLTAEQIEKALPLMVALTEIQQTLGEAGVESVVSSGYGIMQNAQWGEQLKGMARQLRVIAEQPQFAKYPMFTMQLHAVASVLGNLVGGQMWDESDAYYKPLRAAMYTHPILRKIFDMAPNQEQVRAIIEGRAAQ